MKALTGTSSYYRAILGSWAGLAVPRFKCGHEKTASNTYRDRTWERCKFCMNTRPVARRTSNPSSGRRRKA